jgi:hypothetical protein
MYLHCTSGTQSIDRCVKTVCDAQGCVEKPVCSRRIPHGEYSVSYVSKLCRLVVFFKNYQVEYYP